MTVTKDWNPNQKKLNLLLSKEGSFYEGISLCLAMHNELHDLQETHDKTIYQTLIEDLTQETSVWRPENNFSSIAWNLYHITRIEDAVTTLLIEGGRQTYSKTWQKKLGISFTDTGNAWTEKEIVQFNSMSSERE
ncbi:MAG TPA: DinB family protein, partial [Treponemataceae bacterium]|nr:DinB family protein [Treponemataceae bacterium]